MKHRIGYNLDRPIKILGMTIDELVLVMLIFLSFLMIPNRVLAIIISIMGMVLFSLLRRFKRHFKLRNLKSFLWWHFGLNSKGNDFPHSSIRRFK